MNYFLPFSKARRREFRAAPLLPAFWWSWAARCSLLSCRGVKALRAAPVKRPAPGYAPQEKVVVAGYRPARYYLGDIFDDLVDHGDRIAVVRLK